MRLFLAAAALAVIATGAQAQTPQPADWATLVMTADLNTGAEAAWERIGGNDFCAIARFIEIKSCVVTSGKGEVGSLRLINGSGVEIVVGRAPLSYTYAQPFTPFFNHGTLTVQPVNATHSKLIYTMIWNQAPTGDAKTQADAKASRQTRFQAAVDKMAAAANAP